LVLTLPADRFFNLQNRSESFVSEEYYSAHTKLRAEIGNILVLRCKSLSCSGDDFVSIEHGGFIGSAEGRKRERERGKGPQDRGARLDITRRHIMEYQ
jgi:hypothetical protein